jgi:hypothetical protein
VEDAVAAAAEEHAARQAAEVRVAALTAELTTQVAAAMTGKPSTLNTQPYAQSPNAHDLALSPKP